MGPTCQICNKWIERSSAEKPAQWRRRKYCSRACSGVATRLRQQGKPSRNTAKTVWTCQNCGVLARCERTAKGRLKHRRFCDDCGRRARYGPPIEERTKGDLFARRGNWQSARSAIQRHARNVYDASAAIKACQICGYSRHYEVCHIRGVADFPKKALIRDINALSNLAPLCPTHHWEFDSGLITLL